MFVIVHVVPQGRLADAEPYYRQTLQCLHARLGISGSTGWDPVGIRGPDDPDSLRTASNLAAWADSGVLKAREMISGVTHHAHKSLRVHLDVYPRAPSHIL